MGELTEEEKEGNHVHEAFLTGSPSFFFDNVLDRFYFPYAYPYISRHTHKQLRPQTFDDGVFLLVASGTFLISLSLFSLHTFATQLQRYPSRYQYSDGQKWRGRSDDM